VPSAVSVALFQVRFASDRGCLVDIAEGRSRANCRQACVYRTIYCRSFVGGGIFNQCSSVPWTLDKPEKTPKLLQMTLHTSNRTGGAVVGGQVGYNYQLPNNIVVGIESDAQWTNVAESEHEIATSTTPTLRFTDLRAGLDWFGTTRLRLGYAFGRFLPYITGGVSYGEVGASAAQVVIGTAGTVFGSASATHAGWTAGAGAEYAVTDNISFKAEYLFVQLGGVSGSEIGFAPPVIGSSKTGSFGTNVVRAGLNWRFGGFGAVPGIASY
jgi:outer membrane immunogenic protein